jgi:hypothetical protein
MNGKVARIKTLGRSVNSCPDKFLPSHYFLAFWRSGLNVTIISFTRLQRLTNEERILKVIKKSRNVGLLMKGNMNSCYRLGMRRLSFDGQ